MPVYLIQFSYSPETWSAMIRRPEDRRGAIQSYAREVGGSLLGFWYAFGEHDGYALIEAPDNVSVAGLAVAIAGGGAVGSVETTVLLTVEETLEALERARRISYRRPGSKPPVSQSGAPDAEVLG
jgi:uncharacterized protein with GYD domain